MSKYTAEEIAEFERLRGTGGRANGGSGGSNKVYSKKYPECQLPFCCEPVKAIEMNNFKFSVTYCSKHSSGIAVKCQGCGKTSKARVSDCIDRIMEENLVPDGEGYIPCTCRRCGVLKLNSTKNKAESTKQFSIATNYILYGSKDGSELTDRVIKALKAFTQEGKLTRISMKDGLIGLCRPVNDSFEFEHYTVDEFIKALEGGMELPFDVYNKFGSWFYGKFDLTNQEIFFTTQKYFVHYNGKVWFKDPNTKEYLDKETFISKLESGEIETFGIEKQFNEWFIKGISILDEVQVATGTCLWFEYKGQKWYKLDGQFIDMQTLSDRLDSGKYEIPVGFKKQFGVWFFGQEDILTGQKLATNNEYEIIYNGKRWVRDYFTATYFEVHEYLEMLENGYPHVESITKMFGEWFRYKTNILTGETIEISRQQVFVNYKGKTWVKLLYMEDYIPVEDFILKLDLGEIKPSNNISKKFNDEWFVGNENILTGETYTKIAQRIALYRDKLWFLNLDGTYTMLDELYEQGYKFSRLSKLGDEWFYEGKNLLTGEKIENIGRGLFKYKDKLYQSKDGHFISLEEAIKNPQGTTSKHKTIITSRAEIKGTNRFKTENGERKFYENGIAISLEELVNRLDSGSIEIPYGVHRQFNNEWFQGRTNILTGEMFENLGNGVYSYGGQYWCKYLNQWTTFDDLLQIPNNGKLQKLGEDWIYKNKHILTGEKILFGNSGFIQYNGIVYFREKFSGLIIPWQTFKDEKLKSLDYVGVSELLESEQMRLIPTFREQDSESWKGRKYVFEQYLAEISQTKPYLSYIKLYYNENGDLKPIVAGVTGNKLVNVYGTDLNFSTDVEDGYSRRFLYEEGLDWCRTQILIRTFRTRKEAEEHESHLQRTYGLLGS